MQIRWSLRAVLVSGLLSGAIWILAPRAVTALTPTPSVPPFTPTPTPSCAPTGTPYCSDHCVPCPTIRPSCYAQACGACQQNPSCTTGQVKDCSGGGFPPSGCCSCATPTPSNCSVAFYGYVSDAVAGAPLAGATVCLPSLSCVSTDANGFYDKLCYQGQSSAGARPCASAPGYGQNCQGPFTPSGQAEDVTFSLQTVTPTPTQTATATPTTSTSTPTATPTSTPTDTPTCAPTGTPYCSSNCTPCPTIRAGCYAAACGACIANPVCGTAETCLPKNDPNISGCCTCATVTPTPNSSPTPTVCTPVPTAHLQFNFAIQPEQPAVGDAVTLTVTVSNTGAGLAGLPEYSLQGAAPVFAGDTSPISHRVNLGTDSVTYQLQAAQAGTAHLQLGVNYETDVGCVGSPIFNFTSVLSDPFAVTVGNAACVGDCDGSGAVDITEIIKLVNIVLETADPSVCSQGIPAGATPDIALIVQAVNNVLVGCGSP